MNTMKMKMSLILFLQIFAFSLLVSPAHAQGGSITVTSVLQRNNGSGFVDVKYNLSGPSSSYNIAVEVSFNGGGSYSPIPSNYLSGQLSNVGPGNNKQIVWDGMGSHPNTISNQAKLKLIATASGGGGAWPPGTVHCNATPTAIVNVTNPTTGRVWMDRNLGAARAATASNDEQAYGDLYQWGRLADGHQCRNSATTGTQSSSDVPGHNKFIIDYWDWRSPKNNNLWQGVNGINNPCPTGYRLPTYAELEAERQSWSANNAAGAFASPLRLPVAGYRDLDNGSLFYVGSNGYCWSSSVGGSNAISLNFNSGSAGMYGGNRADGQSVRCLKDY